MALKREISILYPNIEGVEYHTMPEVAFHDLGLDQIVEKLTQKANERTLITNVLRTTTDRPEVAEYRIGVFEDICNFPDMRKELLELLDKIQFLNDYGSFKKDHDIKAGLWEFLHRLSELDDYINTVDAIHACLSDTPITSDGLKALKTYMEKVYEDSLFKELKQDIHSLHADTDSLRSITIGVNLNKSFEVDSIGLVSVNNKEFKSSGILGNFADALAAGKGIKEGNDWNGNYHFQPITNKTGELAVNFERFGTFYGLMQTPMGAPLAASVARVPDNDGGKYITHYFDKEVSKLLSHLTKKLERILSKYVTFSIGTIVDLIPEFLFYVRWAEYLEKLKSRGFTFCTPKVAAGSGKAMDAKGLYNFKLAVAGELRPEEIVKNDLDFSDAHTVYLLTGANRGGKTTITQAVGLLFALAQSGISVPAESFSFLPADCIYTHYPADEDKTMDLGRLGEECTRFKEIFSVSTGSSLFLLNETFSTTSFEEGYYIANDAVRALLQKGVRTIYNTHMHKLAAEIDAFNEEEQTAKAASLVALSDEGVRSFEVKIAPPQGKSFADDIARKYGVTYEQLMVKKEHVEDV
ncbi:MAG: DNA mismatch repair protein [Lachnospiraceae bacterium]|nr:DNA mismatch repair protein [Lachnospiraceae bacterium]